MTSHSDDSKGGWTNATVEELKTFGSIKWLRMRVDDVQFSFKAGQWVDFNIPGVTPFTGYSMVSSPSLLTSQSLFDLAVKYSDYPPTLWVHEKCKVGDVVMVRVGGGFFYDSPTTIPSLSTPPANDSQERKKDLLLIAGGVGINPLYSMLQHFIEVNNGARATLLYSAKTDEDFIFKDELLGAARQHSSVSVKLFYTKDPVPQASAETMKVGRIDHLDIEEALVKLDKEHTQTFICGPPDFIDNVVKHCTANGIKQEEIHFEKWW